MCTNLMIGVPADPPQTEPMYVSARAMEMPGSIAWSLYAVPANQSWPLPSPEAPPSAWTTITWTNDYSFVGIGPSGGSWTNLPTFSDGMNEEGLSIAGLWLAPGTAYPPTDAPGDCVSFLNLGAWILGRCASIADVESALQSTTVVGPPPPAAGTTPTPADPSYYYVPLHFIVTDRHGHSLVVEFLDNELRRHRCENGVLTNWPDYEWQTTNVLNYYNLTPFGTSTSVAGAGDPGGGGLQGLPGGPLSASRFVKATITSASFGQLPAGGDGWIPAPGVLPWNSGPTPYSGPEQTAVTSALQLVQICMGTPYGMLLEQEADPRIDPPAGQPPATISTYGDFTMWTTVRDHTHAKYYVMPAFSGILTVFDLSEIDFGTPASYTDYMSFPVQPPAKWREDGTAALVPADGGAPA